MMVDSLFAATRNLKPGMIARLKVAPQARAMFSPGMTNAEQQLADTLKLSDDAKSRLVQGRKLDGYLRIFSSALKIMNGFFTAAYRPVQSRVEVEFYEPPKPGIDKKV